MPLGPIGLAMGATLGAWFEWARLRRKLGQRIGAVGPGAAQLLRMFAAALFAAAVAWGVSRVLPPLHPLLLAAAVMAAFGALYLLAARVLGLEEAVAFARGIARRVGRRKG
jgi:peptidoglycan biosynthesis protein MviN/MurJ (putative lipid II flippase)